MLASLFNGFILGLVASPSCPSNAEEIRYGTRGGFLAALSVGLGAVAGDTLVLLLLLFGFYPMLQALPWLTSTLWFVGALVLAYVAWGIFREAAVVEGVRGDPRGADSAPETFRAFWAGFMITTFNPFTVLWWLGLLGPTFGAGEVVSVPFVSAVLLGSLIWFAGLALVLQIGRQWLTARVRQVILWLSGLVVVGYALYFLWRGVHMIGTGTA